MNEKRYLLDNNVLGRLSHEVRTSDFVRDHCNVPTEVLREAAGNPDIKVLSRLEYKVTIGVLHALQDVMANEPVGDTSLVDLYRSKGHGDPLLLACALDGARQSNAALFMYEWVVVSDDKAVKSRAAQLGIATLGLRDFVTLVEPINKQAP